MADVKWIKIVTTIFDDEKILMIESMPSADSLIVIWFKLLCLAGKNNNSGVFMFNDRIPYTEEMLATVFRRDINTVRLALKTFEQFGMVEIVDNVITIPSWDKHQTLDAYERQKEKDRLKKQEYRKKQKALASGTAASGDCPRDMSGDAPGDCPRDVPTTDKEEDKDKEIEKEVEIEEATPPKAAPVPYKKIKDLYNSICVSFPRCTVLSDKREEAIRARFNNGHTLETFKEVFTKAEASSFLKGDNKNNWTATFDWLINGNNMAKVLDGNYDNKGGNYGVENTAGNSGNGKQGVKYGITL